MRSEDLVWLGDADGLEEFLFRLALARRPICAHWVQGEWRGRRVAGTGATLECVRQEAGLLKAKAISSLRRMVVAFNGSFAGFD